MHSQTAESSSASIDFKALFEAAPGLFLVLDPEFRIVAASDAYLAAVMARREDILGRGIFEAFPADPDDDSQVAREGLVRRSLERVRDTGASDTLSVQRHDLRRPDSDGGGVDVRYWSPVNSPVLDEWRRVRYVIHRVEDVTEFVRLRVLGDEHVAAAAILRERAAGMEAEIVRRSQQLQITNEGLRKASRAKNEFLSRMSHELRTPLAAIMGFSELLRLRRLEGKPGEWVNMIHVAGEHLLALVDEIMDLSRIEAGTVSVSPEPVPVRPLAEAAFQLMQPVAAARGITLHPPLFSASAGTDVLADQQRLTQVIINLVSNAIKYNRAGGEVRVELACAGGRRSRIAVSDTGPGIAPDLLPQLFTPFERLGAAASGIEGTGLGLALSRRLIESMGGTIGVESTVGVGSTFWVELAETEPEVVAPSMAGDEGRLAVREYAAERRVLYVEDVVANVTLVGEILARRPSVRLLPAMLGRMGVELAQEHLPHLILLDLHLPDMSGVDVLAALRREASTRDIPVVVLTADATRSELDRLQRLGARAYLTKPIGVRRLLEVVDTYAEPHAA
ncbi:MAG TPA: ATP-binding protein [Gaiellales bacterium]